MLLHSLSGTYVRSKVNGGGSKVSKCKYVGCSTLDESRRLPSIEGGCFVQRPWETGFT